MTQHRPLFSSQWAFAVIRNLRLSHCLGAQGLLKADTHVPIFCFHNHPSSLDVTHPHNLTTKQLSLSCWFVHFLLLYLQMEEKSQQMWTINYKRRQNQDVLFHLKHQCTQLRRSGWLTFLLYISINDWMTGPSSQVP